MLGKDFLLSTSSSNLWEIIGQSGRAPICAFDHDFRLIAFNQAHSDEFFRIYGYRVQIGDDFPQLFLPEQAPVIRGFMARALSGEVFRVVEEFGDPSLDQPYWEIWYAPLRDASGHIIGAFHHAQDISGRLRAEAELATAQDALRQAQKMEAVGQLTGGIAHDFNNLLMAISGNLQLLSMKMPEDDARRRLVTNAAAAAERGSKLTAQLLAFSRTQKLNIRPVEIDPALRHALTLVENALPPTIEMELRLNAAGVWASTDPDQLELAILNLALNARDAMPDGGRLVIESQQLSDATVAVAVVDAGSGMTPEVANRAVEPFFTTKERGKGTGLGLAQVFGFTTQCSGELNIVSKPGMGTTVTIRLPRVPPTAESGVVAPLAFAPVEVRRGKGQIVLVIDDDDSVRGVLVETLRAADFEVIEASGGEEALRRVETVTPDAAIIDFIMPGMNGDEVARRLKRRLPQLPIIFVSGYFDTLALDGISGAVILRKPFDVEGLNKVVASALG
jgi:signal transduction histidine kinase/CheY-like chemotaxis protein